MLRGLSQRTAVAVALVGVLLFLVGTCVLPAQHARHSCCSQMDIPCAPANASCCAASPQAPPAVVTSMFSGTTRMAAAQVSLPASDSSVPHVVMIAVVLPSQSPPPGIFNLRI
jgi:hypothetical protein